MMLAKQKWQIGTIKVLEEVFAERCRQVARYGQNDDNYDGTGPNVRWLGGVSSPDLPAEKIERLFRAEYDEYEGETGAPTWLHLLREEFAELAMEDDPVLLTQELAQLAALCVSWIESLNRRGANPVPESDD